jgi:hypothetical protein
LETAPVTIGPLAHSSFNLNQLFPSLPSSFTGSITIPPAVPTNNFVGELERIELQLAATAGYLLVTGETRDLPAGSSLTAGAFQWHVGPGFLGDYELEFERPGGTTVRARVRVQPSAFPISLVGSSKSPPDACHGSDPVESHREGSI